MSNTLQPYLFFGGRAGEAIEFYRTTLQAEVVMRMPFKDSPEPGGMPLPPGWEEKIMHGEIRIGGASVLLSDGCGPTEAGAPSFQGFALSLGVKDEAEAQRAFEALSAGGEIRQPLTKTFFAKSFGMLTDRFGVGWMVIVPA